jgi:hypothetical protein
MPGHGDRRLLRESRRRDSRYAERKTARENRTAIRGNGIGHLDILGTSRVEEEAWAPHGGDAHCRKGGEFGPKPFSAAQ